MSYTVPSVKVWLPGEESAGEISTSTDGTTSHSEPHASQLGDVAAEARCNPAVSLKSTPPAGQKVSALAEPPPAATTCRLLEGRSASLSAADTSDLAFVSGERLMVSGERSLSLCTDRLNGSLLAMLLPSLPVAEQLNAVHRLLADEVNNQHERAARGQQCRSSMERFTDREGEVPLQQESDDSASQLLDPEDLAVLRRSSAVSLLSQMIVDTDTLSASVGERRESLFVVKDGVDELRYTTAALQPDRLTFTQQLAFPTLAAAGSPSGARGRNLHHASYNDAERRMNCFAKFITILVLALVGAFFVLFVYRAIR